MLYSQRLEGVDVGPVGDFGGGDAVALAVPGQEGDAHPAQPTHYYAVAGFAEGRVYINFLDILKPLDIIKPRPPDNPDLRLQHQVTSLVNILV